MTQREHSTIRDVIRYLIDAVWEAGRRPVRTRLMKLVYLLDLGHAQTHGGETWTGFQWRFHHFGPYAGDLQTTLDAMEGLDADEERREGPRGSFSVYRGAHGAREVDLGAIMDRAAAVTLRAVAERWAGAELNELLDYVYFDTYPMRQATRGDRLDFAVPQADLFRRRIPHSPTIPTERLRSLRSRLVETRRMPKGVSVAQLTKPLGEVEERLLRRAEGQSRPIPQGVVEISVGR